MHFETTQAIQLTQKTAEPLEDCQCYTNLAERSSHKRNKKDDDEEEDEVPPLGPNGANSAEMKKVEKEIKKQGRLDINPLLREIIENANSINLEKDLKNEKKKEESKP
jgi:hypothetical protein